MPVVVVVDHEPGEGAPVAQHLVDERHGAFAVDVPQLPQARADAAHRRDLGLVAPDRAGVGVDREVRVEVGGGLQRVLAVEAGKRVDEVDGGHRATALVS